MHSGPLSRELALCGLLRKMLPMRYQTPLATRTRTAAKRALSMPLVPLRHEQRRSALGPSVSIIRTTDTLGTEDLHI